ncbi:hypothetical protein BC940DRAFT_290205 [Gongronella butleri]|nr:hypothetical protein BC940DRAFT_290205 [Gongronella butleri]
MTVEHLDAFRPTATGCIVKFVWQHATMRGFMTKHIPPTFSFTKTRKRRYFVLADRYLYVFKSDQPAARYREFLVLTPDTQVFVTDAMNGVLYCLEVRKPGIESNPWFLQADDAESMKLWLERIKKTIQHMAEHPDDQLPITKDRLQLLHADDLSSSSITINGADSNSLHGSSSSSSIHTNTPRSSQPEIDTTSWRQSDATHWSNSSASDPTSSMSSYGGPYTSPPISPPALNTNFAPIYANGLRSPGGVLSADGDYYAEHQLQQQHQQHQQQHHTHHHHHPHHHQPSQQPPAHHYHPQHHHHHHAPPPQQQPSLYQSHPHPHSPHLVASHSRPGSLRSFSRLPDNLPPALPPPTSALPPRPI